MNEMPKQFSPEAHHETVDPYDAVCFFEQHKFDEDLEARFADMIGGDPRNFFSEEVLNELGQVDPGIRTVLLARASRHITTRPSDIGRYLDRFPEDTGIMEAIVSLFSSRPPDKFTFVFTSMLSGLFPDRNHNSRMSALCERRELAPDYLLSGYEYNMGYARIEEEFGDASKGYVEARREANELRLGGDRLFEGHTPFDTPEFEALEESEKSHMLRLCLGAQQLGMVFDEALNSGFTREQVERRRARNRKRSGSSDTAMVLDPIHSMLYGTEQPNSAYEMSQSRFEYEINSLTDTESGGFIGGHTEHKLTLAVIEAFAKIEPDPENVSLLVDFWNKNRSPIFGNAIAEALSVQGPEQAAQELLELIGTGVRNKNALASILYRLELGKIGMSEEGVRYMGRLYNLDELNNPDFFVNRLTSNGEVGVFDDEEKMIGYFELGDLSDGTEKIDADVLAITYGTLFKDRGEVSEEERVRRESFIKEFTEKYFEVYNERFFEKTGTRFNNLTFEEQGWFLSFVSEAGPNLQERVYNFVHQFGEDGIRAFLSMEFDRGMGRHVMEKIAASPKGADILALYNHLVIGTRKIVKEVGDKVSPEVNKKLDANLMRRAKDILASDISDDDTLETLEQVRVENVIFTTAFRTLRTEGVIAEAEDASTMESTSFESVPAPTLSPSDRARMLEIFDAFWQSEPVEFSSKVRASLETSFSKPETIFYTLRHEGEIVGYARVDDNTETSEPYMYFGSFNVDESYGGAKIGEFIYRELIKQSIQKYDRIEADCDPQSDISKFYLRDFVATEYYVAEGVKPSFHVVYDKEQFADTVGPTMTQEKIVEHAESGSYKTGDIIIREIEPDDQFPELAAHRILTRYFNSQETGKVYGVFEYERQLAQKAA